MAKSTLNLRIDEQLKKDFQKKLDQNHETATDVITRAIEAYCNDTANSNDDDCNASNAAEDETVTIDDETTDIEKVSDSVTDKFNELWGKINQQQREIEKLKHRQRYSKAVLTEQIENLEANKLDRAIFNGWAVPYPLEIEPQSVSNQSEDISHQQPTETAIQAKIDASSGDEKEIIEILASDDRWLTHLGSSKFDSEDCAKFLTKLLVASGAKPEGYKIDGNHLRAFRKDHFAQTNLTNQDQKLLTPAKGEGKAGKEAKHYLAYQVFSRAVEIARNKVEIKK